MSNFTQPQIEQISQALGFPELTTETLEILSADFSDDDIDRALTIVALLPIVDARIAKYSINLINKPQNRSIVRSLRVEGFGLVTELAYLVGVPYFANKYIGNA